MEGRVHFCRWMIIIARDFRENKERRNKREERHQNDAEYKHGERNKKATVPLHDFLEIFSRNRRFAPRYACPRKKDVEDEITTFLKAPDCV